MKFKFKKFMAAFAVGLASSLLAVFSNSNVFADCPKLKLVGEANQVEECYFNVIYSQGVKKDDGKLDDSYFFNFCCNKNLNILQVDESKQNENLQYVVKAVSKDGQRTVEKQMSNVVCCPDLFDFRVELPANELVDGVYDFMVYKNGKEVGAFKDVNIKKADVLTEFSKEMLAIRDKGVAFDKDGNKTSDYIYCNRPKVEVAEVSLIVDEDDIKCLSKELEGLNRASLLKNYDNITLVFKDSNTNEEVLRKNLKSEIGQQEKRFVLVVKNDEIAFDKKYNIEILDENENLIGTSKLEIN